MTTSWDTDSQFASLLPVQCWDHLEFSRLGRVAFISDGAIMVLPVNYTVDRPSIVFTTSSPLIIDVARAGAAVAFEVDHDDGSDAWSVLAHGHLDLTALTDTIRSRVHPILPTTKATAITLTPDSVTGRLFNED